MVMTLPQFLKAADPKNFRNNNNISRATDKPSLFHEDESILLVYSMIKDKSLDSAIFLTDNVVLLSKEKYDSLTKVENKCWIDESKDLL